MRVHPRALRLGTLVAGAMLGLVLLWPASGGAHPERITKFPYPQPGSVPAARSTGPAIVVCQRDSLSRLKRIYGRNRRALRPRLQALRRCHFRSIQSAVNAAKSGDRMLRKIAAARTDVLPSPAGSHTTPTRGDTWFHAVLTTPRSTPGSP